MSNIPPEVRKEIEDELDAYGEALLAALKKDAAAQKNKAAQLDEAKAKGRVKPDDITKRAPE